MIIDKEKTIRGKYHSVDASSLFPNDAMSTKLLVERANHLANLKIDSTSDDELISYIRFKLGSEGDYGIPYQFATEVLLNSEVTEIPHTPKYIAGIINRRGSLLTIIDLNSLFNLPTSNKINKYIIIIEINSIAIGLLAENIDGSDEYHHDLLDKTLLSANTIDPKYIVGLAKGTTAIINLKEVISYITADLASLPSI